MVKGHLATKRRSSQRMKTEILGKPAPLYKWVNENNPSRELSYGKGWWDYIMFLYHLDELYGRDKATVLSTYEMGTPPPEEILIMPVVRLSTDRATFIIKTVFDGVFPDWTVSVTRKSTERIPLFGLIDEHEDLTGSKIDGFADEWVFPSCAKSPGRFTGMVENERQLFTFIWVIAHSGT